MNIEVSQMIRTAVLSCAIAAAGGAFARTVYVWNPNGSGGWRSAGQYYNADGVTAAIQSPTSDDLVKIPADTTVTISSDADVEFVNALAGVELTDKTSKFIFNQPSDIQWRCAVFGDGEMVKRTSACVELMSNTQTDLYAKQYDGFSAYCTWGGLTVEKGTFKMPQSDAGGIYSFGPVTLAEDATLVLIPDKRSQIAALDGYGVVTNAMNNVGNGTEMQIGYVNYKDQKISRFYGRLAGGIRWYAFGSVYLYGTESTFSGFRFIQWGRYSEADVKSGHLYLTKFGRNGEASSIGATYNWTLESCIGGAFHYLGTGERTNKRFSWTPYASAAGALMDAGAYGGVVFEGDWSHNVSGNLMGTLLLTGSNTAECVVEGKISTPENLATHFTKSGTGTWRFANDSNAYNGVLAVQDGTFQFTSIAEKGSPCALGMSEILHEPYRGARDDNRIVDYAFLLGASGRMPTFEYVGEKTSSCFTRPLALTGNGGRLLSSGGESELRFAGISAADAGEKTLVLGGDSSRYNIVSNISSGAGSVAVAKEGSGRWIVSGENNISGKLDVRAGRLELWDRYVGEKYTWYRLVVKNAYVYSGATYIKEFALYDKNGVNRAASLKFHEPDDVANLNSAVEYQPINISELKAGEAFFYSVSGNKVYHYPLYNKEGLDKLFDGGVSSFRMCATPYTQGQPDGTPQKYIYIVMRFAEDMPPILRYDIVTTDKNKFTIGVEASHDGSRWVDLTGDVFVDQSTAWASGDEFVEGHPNRPGRGFTFGKIPVAPDADGSQMLADVTSVQVAPGATLAAKGNAQTIDSLTVDCSVGSGTLENIDFAEGGTINLVNIPERADVFEQPVDFGAVSAESLANIKAWTIAVDGKASTRWDVEISSTSIRGVRRGMKIIVR